MALKSNFEATSDISSPFVDEVANPGDLSTGGRVLVNAAFDEVRKIERRRAGMTDAQKDAQKRVDATEKKHGDPRNKFRDKARGL